MWFYCTIAVKLIKCLQNLVGIACEYNVHRTCYQMIKSIIWSWQSDYTFIDTERETVEHYILHCDQYEEAREKLIHDMFLLSGSMHLSLEVLLTVGADKEVSLTGTERIRLLADYIQETKRFDL